MFWIYARNIYAKNSYSAVLLRLFDKFFRVKSDTRTKNKILNCNSLLEKCMSTSYGVKKAIKAYTNSCYIDKSCKRKRCSPIFQRYETPYSGLGQRDGGYSPSATCQFISSFQRVHVIHNASEEDVAMMRTDRVKSSSAWTILHTCMHSLSMTFFHVCFSFQHH